MVNIPSAGGARDVSKHVPPSGFEHEKSPGFSASLEDSSFCQI